MSEETSGSNEQTEPSKRSVLSDILRKLRSRRYPSKWKQSVREEERKKAARKAKGRSKKTK